MSEVLADPVVIALIFANIVSPLVAWLIGRKRNNVETDSLIDQRWAKLNENMSVAFEKRLGGLENEVDRLRDQVSELRGSISAKETENRDLSRQLAILETKNRLLETVAHEQAGVSRSLARWALALKETLLIEGLVVPDMPGDVELALSSIEGGRNG